MLRKPVWVLDKVPFPHRPAYLIEGINENQSILALQYIDGHNLGEEKFLEGQDMNRQGVVLEGETVGLR